MFVTAVKYVMFYLRHKAEIDALAAKHGPALKHAADAIAAAYADARPLIEAYQSEEMPGHVHVQQAIEIAKAANASVLPPAIDPFTYNPNAG